MNILKFKLVLLLCTLIGLIACEKVTDSISDAINGETQRSVCSAYCDWAVGCQAEAREVDRDALIETCLTETKAVNADCEKAETEGLDPLTAEAFEGCVSAIDDAATAGQCEAFTGDATELNMATPPQSCLVVGGIELFNTARIATAETNDELCGRVSETLCERSTSCLESYFNIPADFIEMLDPPAKTQCVDRFDADVTSACREEELYALDQAVSEEVETPDALYSVNPSREAARECLSQLATIPCDELMSGELPAVCAGAFSDPATTANALNGFACGLEREELAPLCE